MNLDNALDRVRGVLADVRKATQSDSEQKGLVWRSDLHDESLALAILAIAERLDAEAKPRSP